MTSKEKSFFEKLDELENLGMMINLKCDGLRRHHPFGRGIDLGYGMESPTPKTIYISWGGDQLLQKDCSGFSYEIDKFYDWFKLEYPGLL